MSETIIVQLDWAQVLMIIVAILVSGLRHDLIKAIKELTETIKKAGVQEK